jgi:hypothetical protein
MGKCICPPQRGDNGLFRYRVYHNLGPAHFPHRSLSMSTHTWAFPTDWDDEDVAYFTEKREQHTRLFLRHPRPSGLALKSGQRPFEGQVTSVWVYKDAQKNRCGIAEVHYFPRALPYCELIVTCDENSAESLASLVGFVFLALNPGLVRIRGWQGDETLLGGSWRQEVHLPQMASLLVGAQATEEPVLEIIPSEWKASVLGQRASSSLGFVKVQLARNASTASKPSRRRPYSLLRQIFRPSF